MGPSVLDTELPLLSYIEKFPHVAGFKQSGTSQEAAKSIENSGRAELLRTRCLYAIEDSIFGLTADETAEKLSESILSVRPRLSELRQRGFIRDSGVRRKNISGMTANVWVIS